MAGGGGQTQDPFAQLTAAQTPSMPEQNSRAVNFNAAKKNLNLTPEEEAFYGRHLSNLYGSGGVDNIDGSRSTLYQATIQAGDKFVTIPTVWDGKILSVPDAIKEVRKVGIGKFPSYPSIQAAEDRYGQMHDYMAKDTGEYLNAREPVSTEEQALAAMLPTEALKFSKELQNRRVYSPEEAKANLKQTGYDIASVTPVLGNLIAAKDAYDYGEQTIDAAKTGDIREQRKAALMTELSALGAVTGLPFGKIAQQTAKEARSTANIFAGPMAKTADRAALEQAQRLEAHGASPDDIWRDTGWGRIDGNWKFEIPDMNAKIGGVTPRENFTIFNKLEHPEYIAAYGRTPAIAGKYGVKGNEGTYYSDRPLIDVTAPDEATARSVTLHELQHHVQNIEGWQGGSAPADAYDYRPAAQLDAARQDYSNKAEALYAEADKAYAAGDRATAKQFEAKATELSKIFGQISKRGFGPYWRTAGEVEARNVQARRDFTPEQSRATPPWQTQDVPPELYTQLKKGEPQGPSMSVNQDSLRTKIIEAIWKDKTTSPGRVRISDIHEAIPNVSKQNINDEILRIVRDYPGIDTLSLDNRMEITAKDVSSAINIGDQQRHILFADSSFPRPKNISTEIRGIDILNETNNKNIPDWVREELYKSIKPTDKLSDIEPKLTALSKKTQDFISKLYVQLKK